MPPVTVYFGLGSNVNREQGLASALDELASLCGHIQCSPVFESLPVGSQKLPFLNAVVKAQTDLSLQDLHAALKQIENKYGRRAAGQTAVPLDIDILLYADYVGEFADICLPREDLIKYAFVMWPMALLNADGLHPVLQQTYAELWQTHNNQQKVWPVSFTWQGKALTNPALLAENPA